MPRKPQKAKVFNFSKNLTPGLVPIPKTPPPSPPPEELIEEVGENDLIVTDEMFTKGTLVEVSSDEEGFHGSWFAATVVESVGKGKYLIEYKCLRTEDDSAFLREEVDNMHIRPHPPENVVDHFKQLDEVDAMYNDGWWVGVISKVQKGSRYVVYFKETCEELEFQHSELRLHQDWIDGKWVIPSRDGFHGSWFAATVVESVGKGKFLIEYKCLRTEDDSAFLREEVDNMHIRPHPPENVVDRFKQLDEVDAMYNDGWWVGVISKVQKGSRYIVYFKETCEELEFQHSELRFHKSKSTGAILPWHQLSFLTQVEVNTYDSE